MDLPTYTNIWRIEKRLYKLYDLRLPMPLPLGQIVAFVGITVPYVLLLTLIGIPFNHNLFWLYVLPPWAITWLATRPVLENKRLSELLVSQMRYVGEPKVWCRMAPTAEKDEITVTGRVWHARRQAVLQPADSQSRAPERIHTDPAAQPAWAPAPGGSRRRIEPRHRRVSPQRPQPATAVGRVQVRDVVRDVPARRAVANGTASAPVRDGPSRPAVATNSGPIPVRDGPPRPAVVADSGPIPARNGPARPAADSGPMPIPVRNRPAAPTVAPGVAQWARRGPASALDGRATGGRAVDSRAVAHEARPHDRAATARPVRTPAAAPPVPGTGVGMRPARRPSGPAIPPAGGERPHWATRARPGPIGGWPIGAPGPRDLEVAHAESGLPAKKTAPRPGWDPKQPAASAAPASAAPASAAPASAAPASAAPASAAPASAAPASAAPAALPVAPASAFPRSALLSPPPLSGRPLLIAPVPGRAQAPRQTQPSVRPPLPAGLRAGTLI